jgi:ATP-binding cassette subfamily B protein
MSRHEPVPKEKKTFAWRAVLSHYGLFLREYHLLHGILFVSVLIDITLSVGIIPVLYKTLLDSVTNTETVAYKLAYQTILLITFAIIGSYIVHHIVNYLRATIQSKIMKKLADYTLEKLEKKSFTFFANSFSGGLTAKMRRFVSSFETLHDMATWDLMYSIFSLLISVGVLAYFSLPLAGIFAIWLVLHSFITRHTIRAMIPKRLLAAEADSTTTAQFSDIISNITTVKTFGAEDRESAFFAHTTQDQEGKRRSSWIQSMVKNSLITALSTNIFQVTILLSAVYLWTQGLASAGIFVLIILYIRRASDIVTQLGRSLTRASEAFSDAQEMVEILDAPNDVEDAPHATPLVVSEGSIVFSQVHHRYENGDATFTDFSLSLAPHERVALVGHSGAGKSTIVKLLLRYTDIESGSILIDGQNIAQVTQQSLRRAIAYVPQEPILFHRSLFENIAYAKPDATYEEVCEVARRARAHEFIERLPLGYDTAVGERGVKLSGGERQRVAIARALLKNAPIVVLDEATSALDSLAERAIQEAFDELMQGRTVIAIAHRLSTIMHMDRIVVLENGTVSEEGTHDALLAKNGTYATLWHSQVGGLLGE